MKIKSFLFFALFFIGAMALYFLLNPSYERSLEAKYYYETGEFQKAYKLAKEAFGIDPYNKMAATIMTQSQYALKYLNYINDAKRYIQEIKSLGADGVIDQKERAKIRMIAKVMIDAYKKLAPSVAVDTQLIREAEEYHEKFQKLLKKAHRL